MSRVSTPALSSFFSPTLSSPPSPFLSVPPRPSRPPAELHLEKTLGSADWHERRKQIFEVIVDRQADLGRRSSSYEAGTPEYLQESEIRDTYFFNTIAEMLNEISPAVIGRLKHDIVVDLLVPTEPSGHASEAAEAHYSSHAGEPEASSSSCGSTAVDTARCDDVEEAVTPAAGRKRSASTDQEWAASSWKPHGENKKVLVRKRVKRSAGALKLDPASPSTAWS